MSEDSQALNSFDGTIRLFPLPNVVLFPHAIQALHVFEPRYRQMTADALAGDRLIAPALLKPGWEKHYDGQPTIHPVVCVGQIVADQQLGDGRYHLLVRGVCRAAVIEEIAQTKLYRSARAEVLAEGPAPSLEVAKSLRQEVGRLAKPWFADNPTALEQLEKLLHSELTLGTVCDLLSFALPIDPELKQRLLEETRPETRAAMLVEALKEGVAKRKFPPEFSRN
jgi:Lon protease-like protein